jgi:hypothetical protein
VRELTGDQHVSPVESKELDQLVEPAQAAICREDGRHLDTLGVLVAVLILRQSGEPADDLIGTVG